MLLKPSPLTPTNFAAYGQVIESAKSSSSSANQGTASRFNHLASLQNGRPGVTSNVCLFRSAKRPLEKGGKSSGKSSGGTSRVKDDGSGNFRVRLLERHPYSSQMFVPINCCKRWLIVVALSQKEAKGVDVRQEGKAGPDLSTVRAFLARDDQGINFAAGVWHHPLIALESTTDFACVVFENGTEDDCHIVDTDADGILVQVPPRVETSRL